MNSKNIIICQEKFNDYLKENNLYFFYGNHLFEVCISCKKILLKRKYRRARKIHPESEFFNMLDTVSISRVIVVKRRNIIKVLLKLKTKRNENELVEKRKNISHLYIISKLQFKWINY